MRNCYRDACIRIHGGLGNQLFQYSFGRALTISSGRRLILDETPDKRGRFPFYLRHFAFYKEMDTHQRQQCIHRNKVARKIAELVGKSPVIIKEESLSFQEMELDLSKNFYFDGYWQSEKYFSDISDIIRSDLQITTPPSAKNQRCMDEIRSSPAISLHIRRGDYLLPVHVEFHGAPSMKYYYDALRFVADRMTEEPVVYIFSDEPAWVRNNIDLPYETRVVGHNDAINSFEDIRLMSACRHHIIANSTFSWWGAWLNRSNDKVVVAPKRWFADRNTFNADIIPDGWFQLGN